MCSVIYDCYLVEWRILKNLKFSFAIYPNDILLKHGAANPISWVELPRSLNFKPKARTNSLTGQGMVGPKFVTLWVCHTKSSKFKSQ